MSAPTLPQLLEAAVRSGAAGTYHTLPAAVVSYDPTTQRCSAQIQIHGSKPTEAGRVAERDPVVENVPVQFPGAGPYSITWPLAIGDTGTLHFTSRDSGRWLVGGKEGPPASDRRHHPSAGAVFVPGLRPFTDPIASTGVTEDDAMVLAAPELRLGSSSADDPFARKSDLDKIVDRLESHLHPTGVSAPPTPAIPPFVTPDCSPNVMGD